MPPSSTAPRAGLVPAMLVRGLAWLALLGMLLGPLAPRRIAPEERLASDAGVTAPAENEESSQHASSRVVHRGSRLRIGPPGAKRWVYASHGDLRPAGVAPTLVRRVGPPRRVVPVDDDPDERLA